MLPPCAFLKDNTKTPIMIERNGNTKALLSSIVESSLKITIMPSVIEMEVRKTKAIRTPRRTLSSRVPETPCFRGGLSESTSPKLVVLLN